MDKKSKALQKRGETHLVSTTKDIIPNKKINRRITGSLTITPPVDIIENNDYIEILADMPGIEKNDIQVNVKNHVLTIAGHRDVPHSENFNLEDPDPEYERVSYHREFNLGRGIEEEQVDAIYKEGVLKIILPKSDEVKPRRIEIK